MKNREIKDQRPAKFSTHIEDSNHRKKCTTGFTCIRIDKFDKLLAGFTGTFHSVTVFWCEIALMCVFLVSFYLDILENSED